MATLSDFAALVGFGLACGSAVLLFAALVDWWHFGREASN